jgi:nucleoside-diphosphate-sugar epimerase
MPDARAVILGCGYVGLRLARRLADEGVSVTGTTRSEARFREIEAAGAQPAIAEVLEPASLRQLAREAPTVVYDLVRPQKIGGDRYTTVGAANVGEALATLPGSTFLYLSSTSVYGRREGEWTDEETVAEPVSPVGQTRLASEHLYLRLHEERGADVRICRVPGIYGPGRTLRDRLEGGAYRRVDDEQQWVSRIHVDDLVSGLVAAWRKGEPGRTYLLCDDEPVTGTEYASITADLLGLPLPPAVSREDIRGELSSSAFERRISARRCSNRRMREELGVDLSYPSVREGVPAALREEGVI